MAYALVDDRVYWDIDGQQKILSLQETQDLTKSKIKSVTAAFIDCESKIVLQDNSLGEKQKEEGAYEGYIVQKERFSTEKSQIFFAGKDHVRAIYNSLRPIKIEKLVPYSVCIRAYIKSRMQFSSSKAWILVDDLGTQAIVTITDGWEVSTARRIKMRTPEDMVVEIKRSRQNFAARYWTDLAFMVLSNNRDWLDVFVERELAAREEVDFIDAVFPALEGLKTAQFGMHFFLPEDAKREKTHLAARNWLMKLMVWGTLTTAAAGVFFSIELKNKNEAKRMDLLRLEQEASMRRLQEMHRKKVKGYLKSLQRPNYAKIYFSFISYVPLGYAIESFQIEKTSLTGANILGVVHRVDPSSLPQGFHKLGIFADARTKNIGLEHGLGEQVQVSILGSEMKNDDLNLYPEDPIDFIETQLKDVYEFLRVITEAEAMKKNIEIDGIRAGQDISLAAKPSLWEGIKKIVMKVSIFGVKGADQHLKILKSLRQIETIFPSHIALIRQSQNTLTVILEVYGK